jgi:hypothetical protein
MPLSHDEQDYDWRDVEPPVSRGGGVWVMGLERFVDPSEMDGRRIRTKEEIENLEPPDAGRHTEYKIGVDFGGGKSDPTGLTCLEVRWRGDKCFMWVRYMRRLRRNLLFGDVVKQVHKLYEGLRNNATKDGGTFEADIYVDSTSLGLPMTELLIAEMPTASIIPCIITGGFNTRHDEDTGTYYIAKSVLVSALMAALNSGNLQLTKRSREFDEMIKELEGFSVKVKESTGNEIYGGSVGVHDDLVVAAALAVWGSTVHGAPLTLF